MSNLSGTNRFIARQSESCGCVIQIHLHWTIKRELNRYTGRQAGLRFLYEIANNVEYSLGHQLGI